jgi:glutamine synthetase
MARTDRKAELMARIEREKVKFMRLQFTDILGAIKNVEVPDREFDEALSGRIMFDGSSIEGFVRIEESDMYLKPDLDTFRVFPWTYNGSERVGRMICDVANPDGTPFGGCPRIVLALEQMGFHVEAAHHEVAPGQHEIDFRYDDVLTTADNVSTFRFVVKNVASRNGLHATFMPKPIFGINGSGMHTHQSLFSRGENVFYDEHGERQLSKVCLWYIGGILRHAKGFCAITNPLVNSYKRLVPGYEAPTAIAWSERNRSPLVRVPAARGAETRIELRMPDPSCNPYLALAVMLRAGLDGIEKEADPGPPVNKNIYTMSHRERRHLRIDELPGNLSEALDELEKDDLIRETLGDHIFDHFLAAKRAEWDSYIRHVSPWEIDRYLNAY